MQVKFPEAKVQLVGLNGDAFAIMSRVSKALRKAGASEAEIMEYKKDSMSGDYDHLLQVALAWVEDSGPEGECGACGCDC